MEVWHVPLLIPAPALGRWLRTLDRSQRERARRLCLPVARTRFLAAHCALRAILGRTLDCEPQALAFDTPAGAPPQLRTGGQHLPVHFNLSHSGLHALVAVSQEGPVGIDIEVVTDSQETVLEVLDCLSPAERTAILAAPPAQRAWHTWRCWVRKEAVLKALGCGLSGGLDRFTVSTGDTARLEASALPGLDPAHWSLVALDRPGHWAAALAWPGPWRAPVWREWQWEPAA